MGMCLAQGGVEFANQKGQSDMLNWLSTLIFIKYRSYYFRNLNLSQNYTFPLNTFW